jgi:hypothetical protein
MTQDEIMKMAREIAKQFGSRLTDEDFETYGEELYCLEINDIVEAIKLVAAKEREACALICDKEVEDWKYDADVVDVAIAIRARGEQA